MIGGQRRGALALLLAVAACAGPARVRTLVDRNGTHAQALAREDDEMLFRVPGHSLERCVTAVRRLRADSDPTPQLDGSVDASAFAAGCVARPDGALGPRSLDVIAMQVAVAADGTVNTVRVTDRVGEPDPELEQCIITNTRAARWPVNANGRTYEKHVFSAVAFGETGVTTFRMIDTVRRLAEPRRAVCECLRDQSPDLPFEMSIAFRLPANRATTASIARPDGHHYAIGECLMRTIENERFDVSARAVDVEFLFHIEPADRATLDALANGQAAIPTDADEPIVVMRRDFR